MSLKIWFLATRPWSLVMTFVSVSLAGILAFGSGSFSITLFLMTMAGLMLAHLASNMANDWFDVKHGVDKEDSPTSQYRPHPLLTGEIPRGSFKTVVVAMYLVALSLALALAWIRGLPVLMFTALGLFFGLFYTADPVIFKKRSFGEVAVFMVWGPLMVGGSYYVLTGSIEYAPMVVSTPVGLLVALVLLANNLRDVQYDRSVGVETIVSDKAQGLRLYKGLVVLIYASTVLMVAGGLLPPLTLITLLTVREAKSIIDTFEEEVPPAADPMTAQLALHYGLLLLAGEIVNSLLVMLL
ncbi:MAG: prenyltransferase [Candidatus Bathyarchaeota archaeon]|jgi:1,4-dihydroxy-2-naphthoate octaprenyltransferase